MDADKFIVKFWGARGGYPTPGPMTVKYGGNTTCIEVKAGKHQIIIDGGTGLIGLGREMMAEHHATGKPIKATILLTHTHHDHTQGFPFFVPARYPKSRLEIFGPKLLTEDLEDALDRIMQPPVFPIGPEELYSQRRIENTRHGDTIVLNSPEQPATIYELGDDIGSIPEDAVIIKVNHGYHHPKNGIHLFRICYKDRSVVIATDTEGYIGGDKRLIEFSQGTDLLIHDAEYDEHEYADDVIVRQGWGHSTWRMAAGVAQVAEVKRLALTHHSPNHDDAYLEDMLRKTQALFPNTFLAQEGIPIEL